jgi:hypothetical protein
METVKKTTGHRVKLTFTDSNYSRYFWGEESYKRAFQWMEKEVAIAEARGLKPHIRIIDLEI